MERSLPQGDVRVARTSYGAALAGLDRAATDAGWRLFDRIATRNWLLEWRLPRWLGESLDLGAEAAEALALANVFGLAYVRLRDDLADGETESADWAQTLAATLHDRWVAVYIQLFDGQRAFWRCFQQYMIEWRQSDESPTRPFEAYTTDDFLRLAHRGAPLKIGCAAAYLLAHRPGIMPALTKTIDCLLVAAVLLDHVKDWRDDLAAGRYNAFVSYVSALAQTPENRVANRRAVWQELAAGDVGRPYFHTIRNWLRLAAAEAQPIGCSGLSRYLAWLEAEAVGFGERLATAADAGLRAATERLWAASTAPGGRADHSWQEGYSNGNFGPDGSPGGAGDVRR
ncbi:MAG: hypothetical protein FJ011_13100 [Chloroflexi bacterium]|nr:hypothetical protein [Chloroflexota bacterium]